MIITGFLLISIFLACGSTGINSGRDLYHAGTYEGTGEGYFGLIKVAVTVTENAVTGVEVLSHADTEGIGTTAFEDLGQEIISVNSPSVDVVTGATGSSEGFLAAVNDALSKARIK